MDTFLYSIWILCPCLFLLMALWAKLEQIGGSDKKQPYKDLLNQAAFTVVCSAVTFAIDRFVLTDLDAGLLDGWIPIQVMRLLCYPLVLLLAAKVFGGTTAPKIGGPQTRKRARRR